MSPSPPAGLETHELLLALPTPHPVLTMHLTILRASLLLSVGTALARDFAVAMPDASTTSLSVTSSHAPSLAAKLARRYKRQVFLSLDLEGGVGRGDPDGRMVLLLEKALLQQLDPLLRPLEAP